MECYMRVSICRMTGLPVNKDDLVNYKTDFKRVFDKADALCGKDMLRLQKKIARLEEVLTKKYPTMNEVEFPTTEQAWKDLMNEYGNIVVTRHRDKDEIILAIYDIESVQY